MVVLDTTLLIDILNGKSDAIKKIGALEKQGASLATTQINVFELTQGIFWQGKSEEKLLALEALLQRLHLLDITFLAASTAGMISGTMKQKGLMVSASDLLIAGTALAANDPIVITRNRKDFNKIPGIKVETY